MQYILSVPRNKYAHGSCPRTTTHLRRQQGTTDGCEALTWSTRVARSLGPRHDAKRRMISSSMSDSTGRLSRSISIAHSDGDVSSSHGDAAGPRWPPADALGVRRIVGIRSADERSAGAWLACCRDAPSSAASTSTRRCVSASDACASTLLDASAVRRRIAALCSCRRGKSVRVGWDIAGARYLAIIDGRPSEICSACDERLTVVQSRTSYSQITFSARQRSLSLISLLEIETTCIGRDSTITQQPCESSSGKQ
eukprot:1191910-Prymnesium_polylepis.1